MEAGKACDAYGLVAGNRIEQADAEQAYIQSKLGGTTPTWVRLPPEHWPDWWKAKGYKDPVCPLILALYGHPDSGGHWERRCESNLAAAGFKPIKEWRSCFWRPGLRLFVVVYVDDSR